MLEWDKAAKDSTNKFMDTTQDDAIPNNQSSNNNNMSSPAKSPRGWKKILVVSSLWLLYFIGIATLYSCVDGTFSFDEAMSIAVCFALAQLIHHPIAKVIHPIIALLLSLLIGMRAASDIPSWLSSVLTMALLLVLLDTSSKLSPEEMSSCWHNKKYSWTMVNNVFHLLTFMALGVHMLRSFVQLYAFASSILFSNFLIYCGLFLLGVFIFWGIIIILKPGALMGGLH
jgi:hypothetical protein